MARLSRKEKERRSKQYIYGGVLLLVAAVVIVGSTFLYRSTQSAELLSNMCPVNGPRGHFVLLVDKTDPLNFMQKQAFTGIVNELVLRRVPEGYLLSVFVLDENIVDTAVPVAELCNPGDGSNRSELTANLKRLKQQYEEKFVEPLKAQSEKLLAAKPANASPIFEMLQLVSINAFMKHQINGERRLIVVSDMLHNTPELSMYSGTVDFEKFSQSNYGMKSQVRLSGVEVELYYLMNRPELQTKRNAAFWEAYFNKAGARLVAVRPVEG